MSIRMLAVELYRIMKEVEKLERELENLTPGSAGRGEIETKLTKARAERDRLKRLIEGAKGD